jgi:hypothetical protein
MIDIPIESQDVWLLVTGIVIVAGALLYYLRDKDDGQE